MTTDAMKEALQKIGAHLRLGPGLSGVTRAAALNAYDEVWAGLVLLSDAPSSPPSSTEGSRDELDMPPDGAVGFRHNPERAHPCDFGCGGTWVCTACGWESKDSHAAAQHDCAPRSPVDEEDGA